MPKRKNMTIKLLLVAIFASGFFSVFAQKIDTLAPAEIITRRKPKSCPTAAPSFSLDRSNSMSMDALSTAALLEQNSMATLRGYGPMALQTASFRGLPGVGTQILLGNQPINSPINGVFDLNLIPAFFLGTIHLQPGGSGGSFGGGAVGGNIQLLPDRSKRNSILLQGGSFGSFAIGAKGSLGNLLNIAFFKEENKLNYPLPKSLHGFTPNNRLENSQMKRTAFQLSWGKHGWLHASNAIRHLPISVVSGTGTAVQTDKMIRFQDGKIWRKNIHQWELDAFGSYEWNQYEDAKISLNDTNHCGWLGSQQRWKIHKGSHLFILENGWQGYWARSPYFNQDFRGHRWNASGKWNFEGGDSTLQGHLLIRKEIFNQTFSPWILDGFIQKSIFKVVSKVHVGQVFRFPTLNDWFWRPGGDPTLQPEKGWNTEWGLIYKKLEATGFATFLTDQILWVPTSSGFWKAENAGQTRTWGVEWKVKHLKLGSFQGEFNGTYQQPRQLKSTWIPLLYQPDWKIQTKWATNWKGLKSEISMVAQGKRNVTTDGSVQLPNQGQVNLWVDFSEKLPKGLSGKLGIQNVFGNNWWYLPYLPGPKFQTQIQIKYQFL
jgi:iron complex outermembrane receptor protein